MGNIKKYIGISGSTLKMIALFTMAIDHIGAVIIWRFMSAPGFDHELWQSLYWPFRNIGRVAFPIFCFLLVEGFVHTRNSGKYLLRLLLFALLSEIPFNLAVRGELWVRDSQNVFWELSMGIVVMLLMKKIEELKAAAILKISLMVLVVVVGAALAEVLCFDYGEHGIISIALIYYFRNNRGLQVLAGAISFLWSLKAILGFLPVALYNGKRGRQIKYFFYIFYPTHLLLFYLAARVAGCSY